MDTSSWKRVAKGLVIFLAGFVAHQTISHTQAWFEHHYEDLKLEIREVRQKHDSLRSQNEQLRLQVDSLMNMHPYKRKTRKWTCKDGTFFGFVLYTPVDTTIQRTFSLALSSYTGPKVRVNSIRRHHNHSSAHFHGKAADFELSNEMVNWLLGADGQSWREQHKLTFFIEGKPGSKKVRKYLADPIAAKHVFFNPSATGDHIHLAQS